MRCDGYKFLEMARAIEIECGEKERKKKSFFFSLLPASAAHLQLVKVPKRKEEYIKGLYNAIHVGVAAYSAVINRWIAGASYVVDDDIYSESLFLLRR